MRSTDTITSLQILERHSNFGSLIGDGDLLFTIASLVMKPAHEISTTTYAMSIGMTGAHVKCFNDSLFRDLKH